jgi:metal iron transporter
VGREGISTLLIASQVALSVVLPFIAFPLIYLTSSEVVMRVCKPMARLIEADQASFRALDHSATEVGIVTTAERQATGDVEKPMVEKPDPSSIDVHQETVDFSNGRLLSFISYAIWSVVLVANGYAITMLAMRKTGNSGHK